ncbi:MAG: hypothetical protein V4641_31855 [Pseudomonadota bacterium]|jgi:hypothetical protein
MSGHRQAAVALHALDDADRSLILDQLPAADQATLRGYLAELTALGFESAAMDGAVPQAAGAAPDLATAPAAAMFALLEHEPAALVAQVLAARQWSWHAGLLALCTPARREAIRAAHVAPAPARTRFLLESLGSRLAAAATTPAAPGVSRAASPLAPLLRLVKSWQR